MVARSTRHEFGGRTFRAGPASSANQLHCALGYTGNFPYLDNANHTLTDGVLGTGPLNQANSVNYVGWNDLTPQWVTFGDPRPAILQGTTFGAAFSTRGDGSFGSGAYTQQRFGIARGLWMEAELSVTMTHAGPSQEQLVGFFAMRDSTAWKAWDHSTGDRQASLQCRFRFPVSSGHATGGDSLSVDAGEAGEHSFMCRVSCATVSVSKCSCSCSPMDVAVWRLTGKRCSSGPPATSSAMRV